MGLYFILDVKLPLMLWLVRNLIVIWGKCGYCTPRYSSCLILWFIWFFPNFFFNLVFISIFSFVFVKWDLQPSQVDLHYLIITFWWESVNESLLLFSLTLAFNRVSPFVVTDIHTITISLILQNHTSCFGSVNQHFEIEFVSTTKANLLTCFLHFISFFPCSVVVNLKLEKLPGCYFVIKVLNRLSNPVN